MLHGNAEEQNKQNWSSELVKREAIKGTPFSVVTTEHGSKVTWGQWGIGEWHEREEDAKKDAVKVDWNKMLEVFNIILTEYDKKINEKSLTNEQ